MEVFLLIIGLGAATLLVGIFLQSVVYYFLDRRRTATRYRKPGSSEPNGRPIVFNDRPGRDNEPRPTRGQWELLVEQMIEKFESDINALHTNQKLMQASIERLARSPSMATAESSGVMTSRDSYQRANPPGDWRFGAQSSEGGVPIHAPHSRSVESRAAEAERMVKDYCAEKIPLKTLIAQAREWQIVWGAVNIKEMQLERDKSASLMVFGAGEGRDAFVVVGEDCAYNSMPHSLFFDRLTAPEGRRVFTITPAQIGLSAEGKIEPHRSGVLKAWE